MQSKLSLKIQGVKGGNPTWKESIGYANIFIDNGQNFILADAFKGTGAEYKRLEKTRIMIGNGSKEFTFNSFEELLNLIENSQEGENKEVKACNEYDKLKTDNELLLSNLKRIIDRIEESELQNYFPSAYKRAKEAIQKTENR